MKNITIDRAFCVNRNYEVTKLNVDMHYNWHKYNFDNFECRGLGLQNIYNMFYDIVDNDKLIDAYYSEEIADKPLPLDIINIYSDELSANELSSVLWVYKWAIDCAIWGLKNIPYGYLHETDEFKPLLDSDDYKYEDWFKNLEYESAVLCPTLHQITVYLDENKINKLKEYVEDIRFSDYIDSEALDDTLIDNFYNAMYDFHAEIHDIEARRTSGIIARTTDQDEYYMMLMIYTTFCYNALQLMLNDICHILERWCYKN